MNNLKENMFLTICQLPSSKIIFEFEAAFNNPDYNEFA